MRFHTAVGTTSGPRSGRFEEGQKRESTSYVEAGDRTVARQEADASSHAFDVWSGRMVSAQAALAVARINRCRTPSVPRRSCRRREDGAEGER